MLKPGLYEKVINKELNRLLKEDVSMRKETTPIDREEAARILAKYVAEVVEKGLVNLRDKGGDMSSQVKLANKIVDTVIGEIGDDSFDGLQVDKGAKQLLALLEKKNTIYTLNSNNRIPRPETSIAQSSLFTGAIHEPSMYSELKKEISSADKIDLLVSFIKWSGLRLIMDELITFTQNGGNLRVITTSYMGATDLKAVEELMKLPN
ncbi:MAG: NgoFVII family restriction endonuclease, partial [Bacillota bacterium]